MANNLTAPNIQPSATVIADTGLFFVPLDANNDYDPLTRNGVVQGIQLSPGALPPSVSQVVREGEYYPVPVSACLDLNSVSGGLLVPRLTNDTITSDDFVPTNGMIVYNTTLGSMDMFIDGAWENFTQGNGDVAGPAEAVEGNIAVYGDMTGKVIIDSGVGIEAVEALNGSKAATVNLLTDLGFLQFTNLIGAIYVTDTGVTNYLAQEFVLNTVGGLTQGCTIVNGTTGGVSSTSISALLEIQSTTGALLLSRMTTVERDALVNPVNGLMIYNTDSGVNAVQAYEGGTWKTLSDAGTGTVTSVATTGFITTESGSAITNSGTLKIANSNPDTLLGFESGTGIPTNITAGAGISITGGQISATGAATVAITAGTGLGASPASPIEGVGELFIQNTGLTAGNYFASIMSFNAQGQATGVVQPVSLFDTNLASIAIPNQLGSLLGLNPTVSQYVTALGWQAMPRVATNGPTSAAYNTALGAASLDYFGFGQYNIGIGYGSGAYNGTAVNAYQANSCIFIGSFTTTNQGTLSNAMALGTGTSVNSSNSTVIANKSYIGFNEPDPQYPLDIGPVARGDVGQKIAAIQLQASEAVPTTPNSGNVVLYANSGVLAYRLASGDTQNVLGISSSITPGTYNKFTISSEGVITAGVSGGQIVSVTTVSLASSAYNVLATDYIVAVTSTTNSNNVYLPAATPDIDGQTYIVKDQGGNAASSNIAVHVFGGGSIDGVSAKLISTNYGYLSFYTDGNAWYTG